MTHEEIDFVIDTLETAIEWAEYADEYFQKKHGLAQDKENVLKSIEILKALKTPKTCENCALFDADDMICNHEDVPEFDVPLYINKSGCGLHKLKDH